MDDTGKVTRDQLAARLRVGGAQAGDGEAVSRTLIERYSCRAFRPDPVPREELDEIFAVAQFSANWCNAQAWQVIVTEAQATERFRQAMEALADNPASGSQPDIPFPVSYEGVFRQRRLEAGIALYQSVGIARADKQGAARQMRENYRLFGAPHVAIITTEADLGTYGAVDCGIYLGNLMALMQAHGIATIAQGALPRFSPFIREFFAIPEPRKVLCGLSFGYADETAPVNRFRTTRESAGAAVRWVTD